MARVEVLVDRDPDGGDMVRIWVDGEEVTGEAHTEVVDPGFGMTLTAWREHTALVDTNEHLSRSYRDAVIDWRTNAEESKYIEEEEDRG